MYFYVYSGASILLLFTPNCWGIIFLIWGRFPSFGEKRKKERKFKRNNHEKIKKKKKLIDKNSIIICMEAFCVGFAFWRGTNPYLHIDGRGFVGKGSIAFWGEAREGCILRKKTWLLPYVGTDSCAFQGEEAFGIPPPPPPVKDNHVFSGKKVQILSSGEGFVGIRLAIHLERAWLAPSPCGEGFTGKDSHAFKGKDFWGRIAVHLKRKKV